jgi:hypothetical protein
LPGQKGEPGDYGFEGPHGPVSLRSTTNKILCESFSPAFLEYQDLLDTLGQKGNSECQDRLAETGSLVCLAFPGLKENLEWAGFQDVRDWLALRYTIFNN